jgi:hypothetical protein
MVILLQFAFFAGRSCGFALGDEVVVFDQAGERHIWWKEYGALAVSVGVCNGARRSVYEVSTFLRILCWHDRVLCVVSECSVLWSIK